MLRYNVSCPEPFDIVSICLGEDAIWTGLWLWKALESMAFARPNLHILDRLGLSTVIGWYICCTALRIACTEAVDQCGHPATEHVLKLMEPGNTDLG